MNLKKQANEYIELLKSIKRKNIDSLIDWIVNHTDYETAPASTKHHGAYSGGLLEHSLGVMKFLMEYNIKILDEKIPRDSIFIMGLCHDLCKLNLYKETTRNKKVGGKWIQVPWYKVEDKFPAGHG